MFRFLSLCVAFSLSGAPGFAVDLEAGKKLARKCSSCHGKDGIGRDPEMPNLAGQSAFYLEKAIKDFQTGAREDRRMTLIVKSLSDEDVKNLAAWFASFKVTVEPPE